MFSLQRGKQRVSYTAMIIVSLMILSLLVCLFVSVGGKLAWLDFLYAASYIKLATTLIKYVPQVIYVCVCVRARMCVHVCVCMHGCVYCMCLCTCIESPVLCYTAVH